ncbi:hypothetical protein [Variovorax sp. N23]|uniref:hypothetical protein n=1 Tax=Variovorax sp. N23 TaxID=2980555 RepID=UPI0021C88B84|nr:hypothetical protein [Variovorax sp. N23]MCU4117470.1 hypothetical protein [Variovorax sp. N23]
MTSMRRFTASVGSLVLTACASTPSGSYVVTAVDPSGAPVAGGMQMTAVGSGVYTVRNAVCSRHRQAVVTIRSQTTGKELEGESPYHCK